MNLYTKVNGKIAAGMIAVAAVVAPAVFLPSLDFEGFQLSAFAILIPALYVIFVVGLCGMALDRRGAAITSEATDARITASYLAIRKRLKPLVWVLVAAWVVWVAYLAWELMAP